ncbi:MAG: hypothetical protein A2Y97_00030 [Nitrospirae bacterium RBG_13_39_12]|nr:MAG: hypothetical protein A2Y97_00030 [Nitrospirae bacterium RBG_13_39_12]
MEMFDYIANWASVLSLVVSIILLIYAHGVKKTLIKYIDYKQWGSKKNKIYAELDGCLRLINEDNIFDRKQISDLKRLISTLEEFQFGKEHKRELEKLKRLLDGDLDNIDTIAVADKVAILLGKLSKKEEFLL